RRAVLAIPPCSAIAPSPPRRTGRSGRNAGHRTSPRTTRAAPRPARSGRARGGGNTACTPAAGRRPPRFAGRLAAAALAATLLAVLGLALSRRVLPRSVLESHNTVIGHGYAVLSLFIGILLALMVVAVWERYVEAQEITESEANTLADLYSDAAAFREPDRSRLRQRI